MSEELVRYGEVLPDAPGRNAGDMVLSSALSDEQAVSDWLLLHDGNANTWRSYRREADRLLAWCRWRGVGFQSLTPPDIKLYQGWLRDPQPREMWCNCEGERREPRRLRDGSDNPKWRPFVTGLSATAADLSRRIIFNLLEHLATVGYLRANPMRALPKAKAPQGKRVIERYLEPAVWQHLLACIDALPRKTDADQAHFHRAKFLLTWLYLTGLRISEVASGRTDHILFRRGRYWLQILGKGNKLATIPLVADGLAALKNYRESLGLPALPQPETSEPIIQDVRGMRRPVGVKTLHAIVKSVCAGAAETADPHARKVLENASAHWLRHTAATALLEAGVPILTVRDVLRHSSVTTTELYLHEDQDAAHDAVQRHRI